MSGIQSRRYLTGGSYSEPALCDDVSGSATTDRPFGRTGKANMNVVGVQESQQRRIVVYSRRIEELETEIERMIVQMIS